MKNLRRGQANIISIVIMITIAVAIGLALWWFTVSYAAITTGEQQVKSRVEEVSAYVCVTVVSARRAGSSTEAYFTIRWITQQTYPFHVSCFAVNTTSNTIICEAQVSVISAAGNSTITARLDRDVYVNLGGDWYLASEVNPWRAYYQTVSPTITIARVYPDPTTSTVALVARAPVAGRGVALKIIVWIPISGKYYEGASALAMP